MTDFNFLVCSEIWNSQKSSFSNLEAKKLLKTMLFYRMDINKTSSVALDLVDLGALLEVMLK